MPRPGVWTGVGTSWSGELDAQVPYAGGVVRLGGRDVRIRPTPSTGSWLLGARLRELVVPVTGHQPPREWPERAWDALRSPVPATPMLAPPVPATPVAPAGLR